MGFINDTLQVINKYLVKSMVYLLVFVFFTFNFIALSISLQCNQTSSLGTRIASGLFAFMFGILYIAFNYLQYRVKIKNDPCSLCGEKPFLFA